MNYNEFQQERCYAERIGKVYGCFEVIDVVFDPEIHKQVWTLRCVHCGFTKITHNGKEYVKGKNKGICQCQRHRAVKIEKPPKVRKPKMSDHELYGRWDGIKSRCLYAKDPDYHNYGGRGITICDEWRYDFWAFVKWAESSGYRKELTIDRIDVDGNYCPENCRWITREEQLKNKRNVPLYEGLTLPDYCDANGLLYSIVSARLRSGMSLEEASEESRKYSKRKEFIQKCKEAGVSTKSVETSLASGWSLGEALAGRKGKPYEIDGVRNTLAEWCAMYNLLVPTVVYRLKHGMTLKEALTSEKKPGRPSKNFPKI